MGGPEGLLGGPEGLLGGLGVHWQVWGAVGWPCGLSSGFGVYWVALCAMGCPVSEYLVFNAPEPIQSPKDHISAMR